MTYSEAATFLEFSQQLQAIFVWDCQTNQLAQIEQKFGCNRRHDDVCISSLNSWDDLVKHCGKARNVPID